jgi:hypothetical protein
MDLLAAASSTANDIKSSYGNLIFMGCFFLTAIAAGIWWLKRNT